MVFFTMVLSPAFIEGMGCFSLIVPLFTIHIKLSLAGNPSIESASFYAYGFPRMLWIKTFQPVGGLSFRVSCKRRVFLIHSSNNELESTLIEGN